MQRRPYWYFNAELAYLTGAASVSGPSGLKTKVDELTAALAVGRFLFDATHADRWQSRRSLAVAA